MSPFSHLIHALRMRHNIRQVDLAPRLGYDQSFLSALEVGIKGPPSMEFVDRFVAAVPVSPDEADELVTALEASQRKVVIDADSPQEIFWLLHALRSNITNLMLPPYSRSRPIRNKASGQPLRLAAA